MAQRSGIETAIAQAITDASAKGGKLTREQALRIGAGLGVDLDSYDICGVSPPGTPQSKIFYTGDKRPAVDPEDVPLAAILAVKPSEPALCPDHQAMMSINSNPKYKDKATGQNKYLGWEALTVNKWEELDAQKAQKQLQQLGYAGIELLTFSEVVRVEGSRRSRERQALVFSPGKYDSKQKQEIMAQLTGRTPAYAQPALQPQPIKTEQAPASYAAAPIVEAQKEGTIDELLLPQHEITVGETEIVARSYDNKMPYEFMTDPSHLNGQLARMGIEGYRVEPNRTHIKFTGTYARQNPEVVTAQLMAARRLIAMDKAEDQYVASRLERLAQERKADRPQ